MSNLQQSHEIDLELASSNNGGDRRVGAASEGGGAPHLSDAIEIIGVPENISNDKHERKESSVSECSVEIVDLEKLHLDKNERDCRICHLSMDATNQESGIPIELGCSCKDDLAAAHKQCAEAWFKIKGNKTCEICGSIAQNVSGVPESEMTEQWNGDAAPAAVSSGPSRNFWQGHRFLNFLLACMVFAFVISWLFHFNVPS
ncbi:hypothetical protein ACS0TY_000944 [Phlomoides rotata]